MIFYIENNLILALHSGLQHTQIKTLELYIHILNIHYMLKKLLRYRSFLLTSQITQTMTARYFFDITKTGTIIRSVNPLLWLYSQVLSDLVRNP